MELDISNIMKVANESMSKCVDHLKTELVKIRAGKANTSMLDGIMVDYYGTPTLLSQVANLATPDPKTISIQAWEKSLLPDIEQAIFAANLGLTPMNDGEFIRISIPPMTEDRRKELVKQAKGYGEDCKVSLRNERQKLMQFVKDEVKNGYPEDAGKKNEKDIQDLTNKYGESVNQLLTAKESDIMTV